MKKFILNLISFSIVSLGLAAAIYQVQAQARLTNAPAHEHGTHGHVHESEETESHDGHEHETETRCSHNGHSHEAEAFCNEHNLPENQCGICQPRMAAQLQPGESMKIRLASGGSAQKAGIETATPNNRAIQSAREFLCESVFNPNRVIRISTLANGVIHKVFVDLGDTVKEGQALLEIASTDIAKAKSDYLKAINQEALKRRTFHREKELAEKNISARQDFHQAESDYLAAETETKTARQQLINWGFSNEEIALLEKQQDSSSLFKIAAPFSGTIVEKSAVIGKAVEPGESLMEIVDLSTLWLKLSVPESQIGTIKKGDPIVALFDALPDLRIQGKIIWISPRIHPETRFIPVLSEVPNPDGILKEGLFGTAVLGDTDSQTGLSVPNSAIQEIDGKSYVFIQREEDLYDLRYVTLGKKSKTHTEILTGIDPQELVVAINSFVLKSEFLKSRFGAGCTHD